MELKQRQDWLHSSDPKRAAAAWHAVMDSAQPAEAERRAFADWLQKSPSHVAEYLLLAGIREQLRMPGVADDLSIEALLKQISPNVETLPALSSPPRPRFGGEGWGEGVSRKLKFAVAASLLAAILIGVTLFKKPVAHYTTAIGEQRSVVLPDGSIAELNTRSTLSVNFTQNSRDVTLSDGEALFKVAKDPARPFRVHSNLIVIRAVGTQFNVRSDAAQTVVTVLEGRVMVGETLPVLLTPGHQVIVTANRPIASRPANPEAAIAWRARRLVFDAAPLAEVAAEFNRYNERQIRIEDASVAGRRITGVFNANDPNSLVSFLESEAVTVAGEPGGDLLIR